MNTVDSWIDPEWIAELIDRLGQPPGDGDAARAGVGKNAEVAKPRAAPDGEIGIGGEKETKNLPEARMANFPEIDPASPAAMPRREVEGRRLRSAFELVANPGPVPEAKPEEGGVVLSPEVVENLARLGFSRSAAAAAARRRGAPAAAAAGRREPGAVMELTQRARVRARLAELRAQGDGVSQGPAFTSAD